MRSTLSVFGLLVALSALTAAGSSYARAIPGVGTDPLPKEDRPFFEAAYKKFLAKYKDVTGKPAKKRAVAFYYKNMNNKRVGFCYNDDEHPVTVLEFDTKLFKKLPKERREELVMHLLGTCSVRPRTPYFPGIGANPLYSEMIAP